MKNNTKENQPFIYDRSTKTKIPVSKAFPAGSAK